MLYGPVNYTDYGTGARGRTAFTFLGRRSTGEACLVRLSCYFGGGSTFRFGSASERHQREADAVFNGLFGNVGRIGPFKGKFKDTLLDMLNAKHIAHIARKRMTNA